MFCSISGSVPQEPVVSKKTGHLYEKRIIEKYIKSEGRCPISGKDMTEEDLLIIEANPAVRPRPASESSIPGLLAMFQNEWDEVMLETFTLKQHLDATRQELSSALYQHDASCRVIAKLMRERDEAREALSNVNQNKVIVPSTQQSNNNETKSTSDQQEMDVSPAIGIYLFIYLTIHLCIYLNLFLNSISNLYRITFFRCECY
jgi:pre-mRNA-processing factor 19